MKTTLATIKDAKPQWLVVDAAGQVLGRLAVKIANLIRGRHKPLFTPHVDMGDYVIVINADKVALTGKKEEKKQYMFYTGYYGNEYRRTAADFRKKRPEFLIEEAVKGMLPKKSALARQMLKKLRVFAGTEHPHVAQNPVVFNV
jgi:large subunit ribosomal protein L13